MVTNDTGSIQNTTVESSNAVDLAKTTDSGSITTLGKIDTGSYGYINFEALQATDLVGVIDIGSVTDPNRTDSGSFTDLGFETVSANEESVAVEDSVTGTTASTTQTTEFSFADDDGSVKLPGVIDEGSVTGFSLDGTEAIAFENIIIDSGGQKGPVFVLTYLSETFGFTKDTASVTGSSTTAVASKDKALTDDESSVTIGSVSTESSGSGTDAIDDSPPTLAEFEGTQTTEFAFASDRGSTQTSLDFVNAIPSKAFAETFDSSIFSSAEDEGQVQVPSNVALGEALEVKFVPTVATDDNFLLENGSVTSTEGSQSPIFEFAVTDDTGSVTISDSDGIQAASNAIANDRGSVQTPPTFVNGLITPAGSTAILAETTTLVSDSGSVTKLITQEEGSVTESVLSVLAASDESIVTISSVTESDTSVIDPTTSQSADDTGEVVTQFVGTIPLPGITIDTTKEWNRNSVDKATDVEQGIVSIPWLQYESYNIDTLLAGLGQPENVTEMGAYFDESGSGVTKLGEGTYPISDIGFEEQGSSTLPDNVSTTPSEIRSLSQYSYKITGRINVQVDGDYVFGIDNTDSADLFVNDTLVASSYNSGEASGSYSKGTTISLTEGWYDIQVRYINESYDALAIGWQQPDDSSTDLIELGFFGTRASQRTITRDLGQTGYTPNIELMEYSEAGGELNLTTIGSPNTENAESKSFPLFGQPDKSLSWNSGHREFEIQVSFSNDSLDTTATFSRIRYTATNVVEGKITSSDTSTKSSKTVNKSTDSGEIVGIISGYLPRIKESDEGSVSLSQTVPLPKEVEVDWKTEDDWDNEIVSDTNLIHRDKVRYESDVLQIAYPEQEPGLALYCNFDEPVGSTTITDLSGNQRNGTAVNAAVSQSGVIGTTSVKFDNENNSHIDFGENPGVFTNQQQNWAVSVWIYPTKLRTDVSTFGVQNVIMARADPDTPSNFVFGVSENGYIQVYVRTYSGTVFSQFEQIQIPENQWSHVSLNQANNKLICRVNGNDGGVDNAFGSPLYFPSTSKFTIGIELRNNVGFTGFIDEPRIFNTGLSIGRQADQYDRTQTGRVISESKIL